MLRIASLALAATTIAAAALGQSLELRPTVPAEPRSPAECGPRAALYGAGKVRVWVLRKGTLREENPLRPLSPETLTVLQVVVNGRSATAFGPNFEEMRQGGAPARLEEASGSSIAWESGKENLPASFRVVSEDGRVLLGPLTFQSCADAPAVAAEKPASRTRSGGGEARRPARDAESRPGLPQGAIPSDGGGGLSLPQP
ncbi:hypothetical protein [Enterovirga aerilata]|uniref:Uncharacterized protein n=1 Tax=Enterovirga aerilata TaxID=2730920 RepID=A0A849HXN5_9HYPH|nr:hypothetical protein [Enterovirga sp. DB1703]NNM72296.1 hypothetical protein [Enterovirga sp. DB1703]